MHQIPEMTNRCSYLVDEILTEVSDLSLPELEMKCEQLCSELKCSGKALSFFVSCKLLKELKDERAFRASVKLADRLVVLGRNEPEIRKLLAQGLIETGLLNSALDSLQVLIDSTPKEHPEHVDALSLRGRCYKQIYCDASFNGNGFSISPSKILNTAIKSYHSAYIQGRIDNPDGTSWTYPAINVVALMERAKIDNIEVEADFDPQDLARLINQAIVGRGGILSLWDFATLGEAHLSLRDWKRAEAFYRAFAAHPEAEAFHIGSSARQLGEVWSTGDSHEEIKKLYASLTEILLEKEGGNIGLNPRQRSILLDTVEAETNFEGIFDNSKNSKPLMWLRSGLELSKSVCQIVYRTSGYPKGTGFVVRGGDLHPALGDEKLLLTNAHIISASDVEIGNFSQPAMHYKKGQINFTSKGLTQTCFGCAEVLAESPREELDFALIRLHPAIPDEIPVCSFASRVPVPGRCRVIIVGHPQGRPLEISFYDQPVTDIGTKGNGDPRFQYIHYTNPTSGGSSGSPVFNEDWEIVGVHHAGPHPESQTLERLNGIDGEHPANEGVSILSIRESVARQIGL